MFTCLLLEKRKLFNVYLYDLLCRNRQNSCKTYFLSRHPCTFLMRDIPISLFVDGIVFVSVGQSDVFWECYCSLAQWQLINLQMLTLYCWSTIVKSQNKMRPYKKALRRQHPRKLIPTVCRLQGGVPSKQTRSSTWKQTPKKLISVEYQSVLFGWPVEWYPYSKCDW